MRRASAGVQWLLLGPIAGLLLVPLAMVALAIVSTIVTLGHSDFGLDDLPGLAFLGALFGGVGGTFVGFVGGMVITLVDDIAFERRTPLVDVAIAMALAVPLPLTLAWQLDRPDEVSEWLFLWGPVFVVPAIAGAMAAWIWRRTRVE